MRRFVSLLFVVAALVGLARPARAEKLRDLTELAGARENQLVGYGVVTGLGGTGDDVSAPFAAQSMLALLRRLGVQIDAGQLRLRNVAAVVVTATLPAFSKQGTKIDITVSSMGNARSLSGGVLVHTLLKGADQKTYAVAQGSLVFGGFAVRGASGTSVSSGSVTTGRIAEGAIVEREVPAPIVTDDHLQLSLRNPSFTLAARIAIAVNQKLGEELATAADGGSVTVRIPSAFDHKTVELVAALEDVDVATVHRARVVVNERTGTIVAGGDVRLAPVAVVHGNLTIVVKETPTVSQPVAPFGTGTTQVVPRTDVTAQDGDGTVRYLPEAPTLADVASALGALGLSPRELTSVLEALRTAGALEAEVVVQ